MLLLVFMHLRSTFLTCKFCNYLYWAQKFKFYLWKKKKDSCASSSFFVKIEILIKAKTKWLPHSLSYILLHTIKRRALYLLLKYWEIFIRLGRSSHVKKEKNFFYGAYLTNLGAKGSLQSPKQMNFRKNSEGGGGGHFRSKKVPCNFFCFRNGKFW